MNIYQAEFTFDPHQPFQVRTLTLRQSDNTSNTYHWHSCLEITSILSGKAVYHIREKSFSVTAGDFIIFNHMEAHGWELISELMEVNVILFPIDFIAERIGNFDYEFLKPFVEYGSSFQNKIDHNEPSCAGMQELLDSICREAGNRRTGYQLVIKADILKLLTLLTRYYTSTAPSIDTFENREHAMKRLEGVFFHLYTNFGQKITLEEMAASCYMSPTYFSSYFRRACGCTFSSYLNGIRVQQTQKLLHTTQKEIVDIALECGFNNLSNFYRIYKRYTGSTPGRERRS